MSRSIVFLLLAASAFSAHASDDPTAVANTALRKLVPSAKVQSVSPSVVPGFNSVVVDGHAVMVSSDGKYLIEGHVYDVDAHRDVMEDGLAGVRKQALARIPADQRLSFAPATTKYRVTVFTDPDCPYCREFHKQIAEYNKLGIAVDYVLFPLTIHPGADALSQTIWCSKDRHAAFNEALDGKKLAPLTCANPIAQLMQRAQDMGVSGTPAIFADDGTQLGGYVTPAQLAQRLQQQAQAKPAR